MFLRLSLLNFLALFLLATAQESEVLSAPQKEALLEKVQALKDDVIAENQTLQGSAISTFYEAIQSDSATLELYLKCYQKVHFTDQKRKNQEAREASRTLKQRTSDERVRALRHQLHWLVYSIEASRKPGKRLTQADKLVKVLTSIVSDEKALTGAQVFRKGLLRNDPFQSVFAQAFALEHLKPDNWPNTPLDLNGLYLKVILPSLVEKKDFTTARKKWEERVKMEALLHMNFGAKAASGDTPASYDKYLEEGVPALQWTAEQLFFTSGDSKEASQNLLSILERNQEHPKYLEWVDWFLSVLQS